MNVVLLVVDSLRAGALAAARTPFLERLGRETIHFRHAYATECWTLSTHLSMFTGLLPSEHRAHFQTMAYDGKVPTIAEILAHAGHHTEVITRNTLFDGTVPGATRGFGTRTRILGDLGGAAAPFAVLLALGKPHVRRVIRSSGFLHALQRANAEFIRTFARLASPLTGRC